MEMPHYYIQPCRQKVNKFRDHLWRKHKELFAQLSDWKRKNMKKRSEKNDDDLGPITATRRRKGAGNKEQQETSGAGNNEDAKSYVEVLKNGPKNKKAKVDLEMNAEAETNEEVFDPVLTFFESVPVTKESCSNKQEFKCHQCGKHFDCRYRHNDREREDILRLHLRHKHKNSLKELLSKNPVDDYLDIIDETFVRCKLCFLEVKRYGCRKGIDDREDFFRRHLKRKHEDIFETKIKLFQNRRNLLGQRKLPTNKGICRTCKHWEFGSFTI